MTWDLSGVEIGGVSVGGCASTLDVPTFKVAVDIGQCIERVVPRDVVLITHGHADHLGAIAQHAAQRGMRGMHAATYLVPPGIEGDIEELLGSWRSLDGGALLATVRPIEPGDRYSVRRDLDVRPFRTRHRVVSQGYFLERVRERLKEELVGRSSDEIAALRRAGEDVTHTVREIALAVTGDTRLDAVLANEEVLTAERLVLEATFLDDVVPPESARAKGHVHLDEIAEAADQFQCGSLLLNHVSPRYSRAQAEALVREKLPSDLASRTQLMMTPERF